MAANKETLAKLQGIQLFEGLGKKELEAILGVSKEVHHAAGHHIVREGASGAGFHLILDGKASVSSGDRTLASLGPGEAFGEVSLIDGGPRSATVTADTDVTTLSLASWEFMPLLEKHASIATKLLVVLCRRLRSCDQSRLD
jgi:CRP-like cAMP-binding protein